MLYKNYIPNIYDKTIEYQGGIYNRQQILRGATILLNALKETYPINIEPYKTAIDTLDVMITVFAHGTIDLLKKLKKEMLHKLVNVVKEFADRHSYSISEIKFNNDMVLLLHSFIEAKNLDEKGNING